MTATTAPITGVDQQPVQVSHDDIDRLDARIVGRILRGREPGWDEAVLLWNAAVASQPALVVQPEVAADVAETIRFVRDRGLAVSVKGGGHNIAGTAIVPGGVTLDMSRMKNIDVDPDTRTAVVGAGCLLGDMDRATQTHGLATPLGFISETGVAGLTLGGGLGYLTRRFGWTVDNLEAVEIVTADGEVLTADHEQHPDLFWALRGGGGNFGVVTRFSFRLHDVGPEVFGGLIAWPFERTAEIQEAYRDLTAQAPRELSVWLNLVTAPPAPFVPPEWHGERVCAMAVCYSGDLDRVDEVIAPIRALDGPVIDVLGVQPYVQMQSYLDDGEPKGLAYYWKTEYLTDLDDGLLAATRTAFARCPMPQAQLGILHLAGALNDRDADDGAVGNRDIAYAVGVLGAWDADHADGPAFEQWVREAHASVRPFSTGRTYINFQTADEGDERIAATYGDNYRRLAEIKRRYDPDNLFRANRNIPPS